MATNSPVAAGGGGLLTEYYSRDQLCHELKITTRTLSRWSRDGLAPPSVRLGLRRLFFRPSVEKWLRARESSGRPRKAAKRS
jgi:predicted site-specific integrase-resolvase